MVATWRVASGPVAKYQLPKVHACAESKKVLRYFSDIKVTQQSWLFPCTFTPSHFFFSCFPLFCLFVCFAEHYLIQCRLHFSGKCFWDCRIKWKEQTKFSGPLYKWCFAFFLGQPWLNCDQSGIVWRSLSPAQRIWGSCLNWWHHKQHQGNGSALAVQGRMG